MTIVTLKKGEGRTIKAGGSWVFDNEIASITGSFKNGGIVSVHDFDGYPMGKGFINQNSKIRVRMLTRKADQEINQAFLKMRVANAINYRKNITDMSCCRLIFGDADFLPGLVVDKYSDVLVVECTALGMENLKENIVKLVKEELEEQGYPIRGIYERSDSKERLKEGLPQVKGFLGEEFDTKVEIFENGVKYYVDIKDGQKTGFFLDQKYNRLAMQRFCKDAKVLDVFTHTGSFALNAGIAGAKSVLAVDASELACKQARENVNLNGLEDCVRVTCADAFDFLKEEVSAKHLYDVVILDPPAFTKSKASIKNAEKGYREININGMKLVKDGGILGTCTCSHFMDFDNFTKVIKQAAKAAHKRLRQIEFRTQAPDHPILWAADESYYLKFYIFQVVDEK